MAVSGGHANEFAAVSRDWKQLNFASLQRRTSSHEEI
jgi:hypothetical protein